MGTTTPGQSGLGSYDNEEILNYPQSYRTGASSPDCLVSYLGHLLEKSYLSVEMQLAYSAAPVNWADE